MGSLLALTVATYTGTNRLVSTSRGVAHTEEVLKKLNLMLANIIDAESVTRGYVLTGDPHYLVHYEAATASLAETLTIVRQLIADNPNQQQRLAALEQVLADKQAAIEETVKLRQRGKAGEAGQLIQVKGEDLMDQIRQNLEEMKAEERGLLAGRIAHSEVSAQRSLVLLLMGTAFSFVLLLGVFYLLNRDIAEHKRFEQERRRFLNVSLDMICTVGFDGYFKRLNPAWERTLGFTAAELMAKPYIDFVHPDDRERTISEGGKNMGGDLSVSFENRYLCKDGTYKWLLWNGVPDAEQKIVYAVARDISERKAHEEELRRQALNDDLTGLFNRRGFMTLADQQLKLARRNPDNGLLLFYADLDGLKQINDRFGHDEGSQAIRNAAHLLKQSFRLSDILARIGGDEFAVLVIESTDSTVEVITRRLLEKVERFNQKKIYPYDLSVSIGMARFNPHGDEGIAELMARADARMYTQKRAKQPASIYVDHQ